MRTYVLVHGAWGGSESWRDFAPLLRAQGHDVFFPSLTGLGERAHLSSRDVSLSTHIEDVVNCIEYQDLSDIVLVGHSYGGMVVTGVQERAPERITHIVYEDAFLPRDGESCWTQEQILRSLGEDGWSVGRPGSGAEPPPVTSPAPLPARPRRWNYMTRATLEEPVHLSMPIEQRSFSRTYVKATGHPKTPEDRRTGSFWEAAARVSQDAAWHYFELPCGHNVHREMPNEYAGILLSLA